MSGRVADRLSLVLCAGILASVTSSGVRGEDLSRLSGADLYREYCASCHGARGQGDGPVASSLSVEVPDLTRMAARQGGTFPAEQARRIVDGRTTLPPHGPRDMPVWGGAFRAANANGEEGEQQPKRLIGLLVEYLRSIQK